MSPTDKSRRVDIEVLSYAPTADADESTRGETRKEQGRRLLMQHRNARSLSAKLKRSKQSIPVLLTVEEEDCVDNCSESIDADTEEAPKVTTSNNTVDDSRRPAIQLILMRKFKTSSCHKRKASRIRKKPAKIRSPMSIFWYECWVDVVLTIAYFIPLFSSSAGRYAKFRSNRRYKLGD